MTTWTRCKSAIKTHFHIQTLIYQISVRANIFMRWWLAGSSVEKRLCLSQWMINIFFSFKFILHKINISTERESNLFFSRQNHFPGFLITIGGTKKECEFWKAMEWKITFKWGEWVGTSLCKYLFIFHVSSLVNIKSFEWWGCLLSKLSSRR